MIDTQPETQDERYGKLLYETWIAELQSLLLYTLTEQEEEQEQWVNQLDERKEAWRRSAQTLIAELTRDTVTLCGSTRFGSTFHEANLRETLAGKRVFSIGVDTKSDTDLLLAGELTREDKERLDKLHLRKIDLSSEILVLDVDGYIGESTRREIVYAARTGKRVRYWSEERAK